MGILGKTALAALAMLVVPWSAGAQAAQSSVCTITPPTVGTSAPNIFNDQQEQDLGDALAEYFESDMRIAPPAANDELTRIGERLLAGLPPTGLHYRFRIYDSGEVNGFSIGGGRVYVSRKLVAAIKNEDELAGVIAHEIGHLATHQTAIEITRVFRIRLGVTQVTDRADIFAKVHRMFSTPAKPEEGEEKEEKDQLVADRVALYAMVRAGYSAESFASFLNASMMNKGKTGNWLSDVFGLTHEASQRYRSALKLSAGDAFQAWLRSVVDERVKTSAEGLSGDQPLKLDPPLRPSLWHIRFSPDGKYVLAQDEGSITVVDRPGARVLFRIDAPEAAAAQFTPDSDSVVFSDSKLRVEQWSVGKGQRTSVKEMVVFDGCNQSLLAPDGRTLVCANMNTKGGAPRVSLRLIDVESGKPLYDKPAFYETAGLGYGVNSFLLELASLAGLDMATMVVSPDGHYLVVTAGSHSLAYDLFDRHAVALGGKLKELAQTRMCFLDPDELYVVGEPKSPGLFRARIFSFPGGDLKKETEIGSQRIEGVTKGRVLIAGPLKDYALGILDPNQGKFVAASKLSAIDAWEDLVAFEDATGSLAVSQMGVQGATRTPLPLGPLPRPRAVAFSLDGRYLAASVRTRAEIWDLETGKKVALTRPFRDAWFDGADRLFGQFPKFLDREPEEMRFDMSPLDAKTLAKYEGADWQYRDYQYRLKPMGKDKATGHNVTLEVKKMETQAVAWTRDYPKEAPACWPAEDDRMVLAWDMSNETAKQEMKAFPALHREAEALKDPNKGLILETVNPANGAVLEQVAIPESDLSRGFNDARRAMVSGEYVLARGEHGNTAIYRLGSGEKVGEFFGTVLATSAAAGLIAATNREDEMLLVDEASGKELKRFTLGSPVRTAHIVAGKDKRLLVLTADQVLHRLALP